jgi:hypothetical protein
VRGRLLVVADWAADAQAVVAACIRRPQLHGAGFGLVVPARLHGLDWIGGPTASVPCAQRQINTIKALAHAAGFSFGAAKVGDPDPVAAIYDALADWPAGELLLCTLTRRVALPTRLTSSTGPDGSRDWRSAASTSRRRSHRSHIPAGCGSAAGTARSTGHAQPDER